MAAIYANENFPLAVVKRLRTLGHDVLTSLDAGRANQRVPDDLVLQYAASQGRILATLNRRDFLKLHSTGRIHHAGIILCTADQDFESLAQPIHESISDSIPNPPFVIRVNRANKT